MSGADNFAEGPLPQNAFKTGNFYLARISLFLCGMEGSDLTKKVEDLEMKEILAALRETGWIKAKAARKLGITERMLNYRIEKYGIRITKGVITKEDH
jgi:DNA-binding NtrC family response regulator